MKVQFLKDHLEFLKDDVLDTTEWQGNYFVRVGVAKEYIEKVKKVEASKKVK